MFKNLKLGQKFFISLLTISILPLVLISIFYYYYAKDKLENKTIGSLQAINDSRAAHINHLIQLRQEQAKSLAGTFSLRQLREDGANPPAVIKLIQAEIDSIYEKLKITSKSDYHYIDQASDVEVISVWDIHGNIVANTNRSLVGMKEPFTFLQILYNKGAYFKGFEKDAFTGEKYLTILEAVRNWDNGEYSGVILLKTNAKIINDITTARKGLGETAENYLVDNKMQMITESRFVKDAVLNLKINTKGAQACFEGKEGAGIYRDYQNRRVLGVHKYLPDQDWCLISEIDVKEAFAPLITFRNQIILLVGCLILVIIILVRWTSQTLIRPIVELSLASREIAKGNYHAKIMINSKDELGDLSQAFSEMTDDLAHFTSELEKKNQELERLDHMKSEFVSTVSHEIRTPMAIIKESISQVLEGFFGEVSQKQRKFLTMAQNNIDRLARIINNLLDLSKLEDGKVALNKETVDVVGLAQEVGASFSPYLEKKALQFKTNFSNDKIDARVDKDKMIQVFTNLIGNAVKFTEKGSITVAIAEEENQIQCSVEDTGKGIAEEDLPKVFDKFQQFGRQSGSGEKGTGLGLTISRGIVELHGGRIWVESKLQVGTKFIFILPK